MDEVMINTFLRGAVNDLRKEHKCFCYFEWQIKEITEKYIKKYGGKVEVKKKDGYYLLKTI